MMKNRTATSSNQTQPNQRNAALRVKGILLMACAIAAFTLSVLTLRAASTTAGAWLATSMRFGIGLLIVTLTYLPKGHFKPAQLIRNPDLIMRGVLGGVGVYLFYATVPYLGAGVSTFISTTYVVLAPLMAWACLGERFTLSQGILTTLAMGGMFFMSGIGGASPPPFLYVGLGLTGAVLAAMVVVYIRKLTRTEHGSTIYAAQCFFGLLICAGPAVIQCSSDAPSSAELTGLIISGIAASIGQLLMTFAYKYLTVSEGSLLMLCAPVIIMVGGIGLFGESITLMQGIGAGLILTASICMVRRRPAVIDRELAEPVAG